MGVVESLSPNHELAGFDCGEELMNIWLKDKALEADRRNTARTFVLVEDNTVLAYYALTAGSVRSSGIPAELGDMPQHPIPVFLLARLVVEKSLQGQGIGKALVKDAVMRSIVANRHVAGVCLMIEALNDRVRRFYLDLGFLPSPRRENRLFFQLEAD
jgi:GNAT superfamily N-acetyltransferase